MADRDYDRRRFGRRFDEDEGRYSSNYSSGYRGEPRGDHDRESYDRSDYSSGYDEPEYRSGYSREGAPLTQDYGHGRAGYTGSSSGEPFYASRDYGRPASGSDYGGGAGRADYGRGYSGSSYGQSYTGGEYSRSSNRNQGRESGGGRYESFTGRSYDRPSREESDYGRRRSEEYRGGAERELRRGEDRGFFERAGDEIRSWFGDEEAERRRRMDASYDDRSEGENYGGSGERSNYWGGSTHTGRGPKGYQRSDERIREDVCERLMRHHDIDASEIEVNVSNGEVTLSGSVDHRRAKHLAEDVVDGVSGVKDVNNQLRVSRQLDLGGSANLTTTQSGNLGTTNTTGLESGTSGGPQSTPRTRSTTT